MSENIIKDALDMASRKDAVSTFGLTDMEGFPFVSAVGIVKNRGMGEFWICTNTDSMKAGIIGAGCKAGLCWYDENSNVTLMGTAVIVADANTKKELWLSWMNKYFKGPEDENYCLIKFTTQKARLCTGGPSWDFTIGEIEEALL